MAEATKKAGISRNVNLHILRHCFASHALEEGMNIKTLQYLMGDSSVHTTMVYCIITPVATGAVPAVREQTRRSGCSSVPMTCCR